MRFFSGFGFQEEAALFAPFLPPRSAGFTVAGFSLGAIRAFEHVLLSRERIERLILLSPAFFENRPEAFKRQQLMGFKRHPQRYFEQFYAACDPAGLAIAPYQAPGSVEELEFLLHYRWDLEQLARLRQKGVQISLYLGGQDRIMDAQAATAHFLKVCEVCYLKNAGHFLREV